MARMNGLQVIIERIMRGAVATAEIRELLYHRSPLVRAAAVRAIGAAARNDERLVDELIAAATAPINGVPLLGTISVAHVAVGCLPQIGTATALKAAKALVMKWPEPDRTDLILYLKLKGLEIH